MCVISIHNLVHLPNVIKRFSSPDNFWCYTFERAVHTYVEQSSNNKNLEKTYANAECRRELFKILCEGSDLGSTASLCEHQLYPNRCMQRVCIQCIHALK